MSKPTRFTATTAQASPRSGFVGFLVAASLGLSLAACSADSVGNPGNPGNPGTTGNPGSTSNAGSDVGGSSGQQGQPGVPQAGGLPGFGVGGGGMLTFDGQQIPIDSATCMLQEDTYDVGTVSANQFRVLVSLNNPLNPISVQILDTKFLQWFPKGSPANPVTRNGSVFTSPELTYFNNSNDRTVTASFTIECP